jgi:hypothetical protein
MKTEMVLSFNEVGFSEWEDCKACPPTVPPSFSHSIHGFGGRAEFPPEERLARPVSTMKILPVDMKRVPGMSLDLRPNGPRK